MEWKAGHFTNADMLRGWSDEELLAHLRGFEPDLRGIQRGEVFSGRHERYQIRKSRGNLRWHVHPGALTEKQVEIVVEALLENHCPEVCAEYVHKIIVPEAIHRLHTLIPGLSLLQDAETFASGGTLTDLDFVPLSKSDLKFLWDCLKYEENELNRIDSYVNKYLEEKEEDQRTK